MPRCATAGRHQRRRRAIAVMVNAGLRDDVAALELTGADGIGLFRTEFQFLVSATLPRPREPAAALQARARRRRRQAGDLPHRRHRRRQGAALSAPTRQDEDENPAMGWRALRLALDRDGLMKAQARALIEAAAGRDAQRHVPDGLRAVGIRRGARRCSRSSSNGSATRKKLLPTRIELRRDARSAGAGRDARRAAAEGRFPVDRHQRSHPVPVRRRPRQPAGSPSATTG